MIRARPGTRGLAFSVLLLLPLLSACSPDYIMIVDPVFETIFFHGASFEEQFEEQIEPSIDVVLSLAATEPLGNQAVAVVENRNPASGVVLTPLFFSEAATLASSRPELKFLLLAESSATESNLLTVTFDRVGAFREAGEAAADYLQSEKASLVLMAETGTNAARREIEAFEDGLAGNRVERRFVYSRSPERETIRQQVLSVGEGKHLWALFLRGNTTFALDLVATRQESAIAEDLGPGGGYTENLLGSIERPYGQAVAMGIERLSGSESFGDPLTVAAVFRRLK